MKNYSFNSWYNFNNYNSFLKTYNLQSNYNNLKLFKNYYYNNFIPFLIEKDYKNYKSKTIL